MTLGLTGLSYWLLKVTFGVGWLTPEATVALWFAQLCAYIILALVEDSYLVKEFGEGYVTYKNKVPFFLPFGKMSRFDLPLSIVALSLLLLGVIFLQFVTFF